MSGSTTTASRLLELVTSSWMSQAAYVAARLGVPDVLAGGARTPEQVAMATGAHAPSVRRLLRALTTLDICREGSEGCFELTEVGALLRTDVPDSLRSWTLFWGEHAWPLWGRLLYSVTTGESARALITGANGAQHLERDRKTAELFHQAMVELTRRIARDLVRAYDFSNAKRVVDVGGGYGEVLAAILEAAPGTIGLLLDLPHAIENARRHLEAAGMASRCEFAAGSFFASIPTGGDVYILKSVIHDWNDVAARKILENCRRAMAGDARLLLVERIVPERLEATPDHRALARSDLHMLVAWGARERTEAEFRALLRAAGFRTTRILPLGSTFAVVEAVPAGDVWSAHAQHWSHVGSPLRPAAEDVAGFRTAVEQWLRAMDRSDPTLLLMGVTPELCDMPIPAAGRVIAVDRSHAMIGSVWPGPLRVHDMALCADWRAMPLSATSVDLVLADGALTILPHPSGYAATCDEIRRILRRGGRWVIRCFAQRETRETVDEILADLERSRIGSFHVLKWRLAMALQPDPTAGVPVEAVWSVVQTACGGVARLADRLGWPVEEVRTIESYRHADTRYSFPTLAQLRAVLTTAGFTVLEASTPRYELGERCPMLVLTPIPS